MAQYEHLPIDKQALDLDKVLNLGCSVVIIHETESYLGRLKQRLPVVKLFKQGLSHE